MMKINSDGLYTDGGVILKNPSPHGGTWAACLVQDGKIVSQDSGIIITGEFKHPITNNVMEMYAVIRGLELVPETWYGKVYSDSQVTLGRVSGKYHHFHGIPYDMRVRLDKAIHRLSNHDLIQYILVGGHPTLKELSTGHNSKGVPVSEFNVWCDKECNRLSKEFISRKERE